jgi:hypothetical protein
MATTSARQQQRRRTAAQWASENPVLNAGEVGCVVNGTDVVAVKIGNGTQAWNSLPGPIDVTVLPELVAGLAVVLTPAGSWPTATTTVAVDLIDEDSMATDSAVRPPSQQSVKAYVDGVAPFLDYITNQYYYSSYDSATANAYSLNTVYYAPTMLRAGTIDSISVEVTTGQASGIIRLGIYNDSAGIPGTLVAEAGSTADASTTGAKTLSITAVLPANGPYWFASVNQGSASGVAVQHVARGGIVPVPLGTGVATGAGAPRTKTQGSVTGALPGTASVANSFNSHSPRIQFRYSA